MGTGSFCELWACLALCALMLLRTQGAGVGITYLESAVAKGAGEDKSFFLFL